MKNTQADLRRDPRQHIAQHEIRDQRNGEGLHIEQLRELMTVAVPLNSGKAIAESSDVPSRS